MEKKLQNPTSNKNETPAPQGGKWPDETIIRYIIRAFLLLIVFAWALVNIDAVLCFLGKVLALFTPFLIGGAIAFLINVVLRPMECCWNKACRKAPAKLTRPVCLTASTVLILGILFAVVFMMLPSLRESGDEFIQNIPVYVEEIGRWWAGVVQFAAKYNIVLPEYVIDSDLLIEKVTALISDEKSGILTVTWGAATSVLSVFVDVLLGLVFALYLLAKKEVVAAHLKKLIFPNTEVYDCEMPGGQFSNLKQQAKAVGLGDRWNEIKKMYHDINLMFGDIVKVTPSSKVVGDMTLFMVQNDLTEKNIYERGDSLDYPQSVVEFFEGRLGVPYEGFPKKLQAIILKGRKPLDKRPGALLDPIDFEAVRTKLENAGYNHTDEDVNAYCQYPKVFKDYEEFIKKYGDVSVLDTPTFFFGMTKNEEITVTLDEGVEPVIKLINVSDPDDRGMRTVTFMFNGAEREIDVIDKNVDQKTIASKKADPNNPGDVAATLSGSVVNVLVKSGENVKKGQSLAVTEAMKMETTITSPIAGTVGTIYVTKGQAIMSGDCLLEIR